MPLDINISKHLSPIVRILLKGEGGGGGAVDTNDWCIKLNRTYLFLSHCHIESEVEECIA